MQNFINKEKADELIISYFTQDISKTELAELQQWLLVSNENKSYFFKQKEIWFATLVADDRDRFDTNKAYERFRLRTQITDVTENVKFISQPWLRIAAVIVILLTVAGGAFWSGSKSVINHFSEITMEAPLGSRNKVYLPDGTLVWLNVGSRISYSQGYGINDRIVKLEGEGYFEVTKNADLPFNVKTKELVVKVLGTKFNFKNYANDEETIVTLLEGKVDIDKWIGANENFELIPNQRIVLNKSNGKVKLQSLDAHRVANWTRGMLIFDDEKLTDIVRDLERDYNIEIKINDDILKNLRFYANFNRSNQTIDEIMNAIASTGKLRYKYNEKRIILYHN